MGSVITLRPCQNVVTGLRAIADEIERGDLLHDRLTIVAGDAVYHVGALNDCQAAKDAVFDLNIALSRIMLGAHQVPTGGDNG